MVVLLLLLLLFAFFRLPAGLFIHLKFLPLYVSSARKNSTNNNDNSSLALILTNFFLTQTHFRASFFSVLFVVINGRTNIVLHLLDPGIFQYTTVQYVPAQKSVPLQLMLLLLLRWLCYHSHCKRSANKQWSQHSVHKSHLNIGRVKWIHPFSLPTSFNWCLWVELNTCCCCGCCSLFPPLFLWVLVAIWRIIQLQLFRAYWWFL